MKEGKIIFVLGQGRSGTSLLNKVLSAHPEIYFLGLEFNDLPFFYQNEKLYDKYGQNKYGTMAKDFLSHPAINKKPTLSKRVKDKNFREFFDYIFNLFRKKTKTKIIGLKIIDKIPENVSLIESSFPEAYCLHIIRDPRDVFLSLKKTPFGTKSPYFAGLSWKKSVQTIRKLEKLKHYYEIYYEEFLTDQERELKKLCSFLGIKFSQEMLEFHQKIKGDLPYYHRLLKKGFVKNNFNKWRRELAKDEINLVHAAAGKLIYELGYSDKENVPKINALAKVEQNILDKIFFLNFLKAPTLKDKTWSLNNRFQKEKYFWQTRLKRNLISFPDS